MSGRPLLVIQPGGLGDLVQLADLFQDMAAAWDGPVDLLTAETLAPLAESWGAFRRVIPFPAEVLYRGGVVARLRLLPGLARGLRARRYRTCVVFKAHPGFALLARVAGIPERCGFRRGPSPFLTRALELDPDMPRTERARRLAALALGSDPGPVRERTHGPRPIRPGGPRIAMAPGGARNAKDEMPSRRWPVSRYQEAARALSVRFPDADFFVIGGTTDAQECAAVAAALPRGRVRNLCGRVALEAMEGVFAGMDVVVTHDSGPMHVAVRSGCGLVGVFGPTDPGVVLEEQPGIVSLWQPAGPRPCHDEATGRVACRHDPCCVERVASAMVVAAVERLLTDTGGPSRED